MRQATVPISASLCAPFMPVSYSLRIAFSCFTVTKVFLNELSKYVRNFDSEESRAQKNVGFIKEAFGYPEEDIKVRRATKWREN